MASVRRRLKERKTWRLWHEGVHGGFELTALTVSRPFFYKLVLALTSSQLLFACPLLLIVMLVGVASAFSWWVFKDTARESMQDA